MQEKNQKKNKKKGCLLLGILLIIIGIGMVLIKYYQRNEIQDLEEININDFYELQEEISSNQENEIKQEKIEEVKVEENIYREPYLAVLKIDKINLERGIYSINSKNNNVNKNIQLLKESNLPDKENGNVIIAGHSGNSYKAYFKNLVKLNNGDESEIVYNGKTYIYSLSNSYEVEKTGRVEISRNINKQTLTLITCKHNTNKQIVFVFELKNIIQEERKMKKKNQERKNRRKFLIVAGISAFTILGGTLAYFTTSDTIQNVFKTALYQHQITEKFESPDNWTPGTTTEKTINVTNTC